MLHGNCKLLETPSKPYMELWFCVKLDEPGRTIWHSEVATTPSGFMVKYYKPFNTIIVNCNVTKSSIVDFCNFV
jgi:hypothetical protein